MAGSIYFEEDRGRWTINFPYGRRGKRKKLKVRKWRGHYFYQTHKDPRKCQGHKRAEKCLSIMQAEVDRGVFRPEAYTTDEWSDTAPYLNKWLDAQSLAPSTYKTYRAAVTNHLIPFFKEHEYQLHEIQLDTLTKLLRDLQEKNLSPKYCWNIMNTLHACMHFAYDSHRIERMPSFPKKAQFKLCAPDPQWVDEATQLEIIANIPKEHRPIFMWMKMHYRRPCEAMSLFKSDWNKEQGYWLVQRSISDRKLVERTKDGQRYIAVLDPDFLPYWPKYRTFEENSSDFFFTCKSSRSEGKRYTDSILNPLWNAACAKVGVKIAMYPGTRHSSVTQYLVEKGGSLDEAQELTQHSNKSTLRRHYAAARIERMRKAMMRGKVIPFGDQTGTEGAGNP